MKREDEEYIAFLERIVVSDARGALIALYFFLAVFFALAGLAWARHATGEEHWVPEILSRSFVRDEADNERVKSWEWIIFSAGLSIGAFLVLAGFAGIFFYKTRGFRLNLSVLNPCRTAGQAAHDRLFRRSA